VHLHRGVPGFQRSVHVQRLVVVGPFQDVEEVNAPGQINDQVAPPRVVEAPRQASTAVTAPG